MLSSDVCSARSRGLSVKSGSLSALPAVLAMLALACAGSGCIYQEAREPASLYTVLLPIRTHTHVSEHASDGNDHDAPATVDAEPAHSRKAAKPEVKKPAPQPKPATATVKPAKKSDVPAPTRMSGRGSRAAD